MNKYPLKRLAAIALAGAIQLVFTAPAFAQQNMKPGLWEINNKMGGSGDMGSKMAAAQAEMQKQLAAMPPEQRKQMEKMMADKGVGMSPGAGVGSGGNMALRVCISKEMAARNEPPAQQGDCKQETLQKSGNTTKFKFTCSKPPTTGEGEYTILSPEAYTMKMKTVSQVKGKAEEMTMDAQGKATLRVYNAVDVGQAGPLLAELRQAVGLRRAAPRQHLHGRAHVVHDLGAAGGPNGGLRVL